MTKRKHLSRSQDIVAEFHFSPLEHALFDEMKNEAELDNLVDSLFSSTDKSVLKALI